MRTLVLVIALAGACASAEPAAQTGAQTVPSYEDARSQASDSDIRDARRAYRSACEQHQSTAYCDCMTGGMAQMLSPGDLRLAIAALSGQSAPAHVEAARTEVDRGCARFRGA